MNNEIVQGRIKPFPMNYLDKCPRNIKEYGII